MGNTQQQGSGAKAEGLKEAVIVIGILTAVVGAAIGTYWIGSDRGQASAGKPEAETAGATTVAAKRGEPSPSAPTGVAPVAAGSDVQHVDIYFDFNRTRLRADAVTVLQDKAGIIKQGGTWAVLVLGYADGQGPAEYNKGLAQRRAEMVKQFLVELGIPATSMKIVTIGPDGSLCDQPSQECRQLNRRVHLEMRKLALPAPAPAASVVTEQPGPDTATRP